MKASPFSASPSGATRRLLVARNPYTGADDFAFDALGTSEVAALADRLKAAQPNWAALGLDGRVRALAAFADAIRANAGNLFEALAQDVGRDMLAQMEVTAILGMIERWSADAPGLIDTIDARARALPSVRLGQDLSPYPLVGVVSPWNYPLLLSLIDAIPALLAGCAVLVKPSEVTPRFAGPLEEALADVPELAAVLAFAIGDGATGAAVVDVADFVCFTGSVATGRRVAEACARRLIPACLELGGKDPAIVLDGADLDIAATAILRAAVAGTGQACQSIERIYVEAAVHDDFVRRLVEKASAVELNWPDRARGQVGPFIFDAQAAIVAGQVDDAIATGATLHCGGKLERHGGAWMRPAVLTGVTNDMRLMQEETFGPVLPVVACRDADEAIRLANDSVFGLSAAVFAADTDTALAVARKLSAGAVSVNDAGLTVFIQDAEKNSFGASGLGPSRMGAAGFTRFFRKKALMIQTGPVLPLAILDEAAAAQQR